MVKKPSKPPRPIISTATREKLVSFGQKVLGFVDSTSRHPATFGLAIMAVTGIAQALAGPDGESEWKKNFKFHMGGLYAGAQGSIVALAVAPAVTQAISSGGQIASAMYGKPPP